MQFLGEINEQGVLTIIDYEKYQTNLNNLAGKEVEVVVRKRKKMSTKKQRQYYWGGILRTLGGEIGYDPTSSKDMDALHNALKNMFLQYKDERTGLLMTYSTEGLTTIERNKYHEHIRTWSQEFHNCYIPLPEEFDAEEKFINNGGETMVIAHETQILDDEDILF